MLTDNLIRAWHLNNTLIDGVAGSQLVAIDGVDRYVTGKLGGAWDCGGVATRALKTMSPAFDITSAFTVSIWHKFTRTITGSSDGQVSLFELRNTSTNRYAVATLGYSPGYWWIEAICYQGYIVWEPPTLPFDNNWHNWIFVFANGTGAAKIYLDGVLKKSGSVNPQAISPNRFTLGARANGTGAIAPADTIDGFHWWSRALSAAEVAEVYNGGAGWEYAPDTTPNAFDFVDVADADPATVYESGPQTIVGMDPGTAISISGGEYRVNGGSWTSEAGTIASGQTLELRATSSAESEGVITVTVTVGTVSADWTITTGVLSSVVSNIVGSSILGSRIFRSRIVRGHV